MEYIFINEAFDHAIKDYLKLKKTDNEVVANSFAIMVLRMLAYIYGEVDIVNPYILKSEKSFRQNITRFGYSNDNYNKFKEEFLKYYEIEKENKDLKIKKANPYFVSVQKSLIEMFMKKRENYKVSLEEESQFFNLLYTTKTDHPLRASYNFLTAHNIKEVEEYYYQVREQDNEKNDIPKKSNVLNIEAYEILNYSLTDIANMDSESVDKINENVYDFFEIDEEAENKNDLLNFAIENYKKNNSRLSSGNGYVDILLVMGVVVTGIMILTIASLVIF